MQRLLKEKIALENVSMFFYYIIGCGYKLINMVGDITITTAALRGI